jgi:hypothetical protein
MANGNQEISIPFIGLLKNKGLLKKEEQSGKA